MNEVDCHLHLSLHKNTISQEHEEELVNEVGCLLHLSLHTNYQEQFI